MQAVNEGVISGRAGHRPYWTMVIGTGHFSQTLYALDFLVLCLTHCNCNISHFSLLLLRQISSNGRRPLPPECHGLVDQISWLAYRQRVLG